jgi:predicted phage terminase large subunit-like protein
MIETVLDIQTLQTQNLMPLLQKWNLLSEKRDRLLTEKARRNLVDFAQYIDPGAATWYQAEHLHTVAAALERLARGESKRLAISLPPRHWKSSLATIKFSLWWLGHNEKASIILVSYAQSLADAFSKQIRDAIETNRFYRRVFPCIKIKRDSNRADDWCLVTGYQSSMRAAGVGSGITGRGGKLLLFDDVMDPKEAPSSLEREKLWTWYQQVARPRLEPDGRILIVNTRCAEDDLIGRLQQAEKEGGEKWEYINISAERASAGTTGKQYLWEERYTVDEYAAIRSAVGEYVWRSQYCGQTTTEQGIEIQREWFEYVDTLPQGTVEQCRAIDTAWTLKKTQKHDPDYMASVGSASANGWLYLVDPFKMRKEMPEVVDWIQERKRQHPRVRIGMAKAAGETIGKQFLARLGIPIEELAAEREDLRIRLSPFIWYAKHGKIKLVGTAQQWEAFIAEATAFPNGKHDDLLACCAELTQMHGLKIPELPQLKAHAYDYESSNLINAMSEDM